MWRTRSSPSPSPRRMSVRQRSKRSPFSRSFASAMLPTVSTSSPMRTSVSSRSSRISGSSSTTSTCAAGLSVALSPRLISYRSCGARLPAEDAEVRAAGVVHVLQCRAIRVAKLAREVEPEPGTLRFRGEKRLEELRLAVHRHAGPVVDHRKLDAPGVAAKRDAHGPLLRPGIARCVAKEVPHHLPQVLAIELDPGVRRGIDREAGRRGRLIGDEFVEKLAQPRVQADRVGGDAVAAVELQHGRNETLQAARVVVDDARQPLAVLAALFLLQELGGMADGGERVADLVRDVGGEASERGELELLGLLARPARILDEDDGVALLGTGIEQAQADVASAHRQVGAGGLLAAARAPGAPASGKARQQLLDARAHQALAAQEHLSRRVVLHDEAVRISHQYAVVHVVQHQLVDALLRGELAPAQLRQP